MTYGSHCRIIPIPSSFVLILSENLNMRVHYVIAVITHLFIWIKWSIHDNPPRLKFHTYTTPCSHYSFCYRVPELLLLLLPSKASVHNYQKSRLRQELPALSSKDSLQKNMAIQNKHTSYPLRFGFDALYSYHIEKALFVTIQTAFVTISQGIENTFVPLSLFSQRYSLS